MMAKKTVLDLLMRIKAYVLKCMANYIGCFWANWSQKVQMVLDYSSKLQKTETFFWNMVSKLELDLLK